MAHDNLDGFKLKVSASQPAVNLYNEREDKGGRRADLADSVLRLAFRAAKGLAAWVVEPMRGEDGKLHWQALLWSNGRARW
jgi:4-aminobutyrate aminotransferase-like enzyme